MGAKEGKGTRKTMLNQWVAWKWQARENWPITSDIYSMRWEASQRILLSSGVSEHCGGATWSRVLEVLAPLATRNIPHVASRVDRGICCSSRWGLHEAGDAREKRYSVDGACPRTGTFSCLWPEVWPGALMARNQSLCLMYHSNFKLGIGNTISFQI